MIFPITGTVSKYIDLDFQGISLQYSEGFPSWFNISSGSVLRHLINSFSEPIEHIEEKCLLLQNSFINPVKSLYEDRLGYIAEIPDNPLEFSYSLSGTVYPINRCHSIWELKTNIAPCVYIENNTCIFKNITRHLRYSVSGHTSNHNIEDQYIYWSEDSSLVPTRWEKTTNITTVTKNNIYIWESIYSNNVRVNWRSSTSSGSVLASPIDFRNSLDERALNVGLHRNKNETNNSLLKRINIVGYKLTTSSIDNLYVSIACNIGGFQEKVWNSATTGTAEGKIIFENLPQTEYKETVLYPSIKNNEILLGTYCKNPVYEEFRVNNLQIFPTKILESVYTLDQFFPAVTHRCSYKNYNIVNNILSYTANTKQLYYNYLDITGIVITPLNTSSANSLLYDGHKQTEIYKRVVEFIAKKCNSYYGNATWGISRFTKVSRDIQNYSYTMDEFED